MTEASRTGNPFFDAWMDAGRRFLVPSGQATQLPSFNAPSMTDAMTRAEENWQLCQRQAADWVKASSRWLTSDSSTGKADGIAEETLRRMLDPTRFLFAGTDEINQAIQRLVEGPEFADIGTIERQLLKATSEWLALREASAAYRAVTAGAWSRAFQTFSKETAKDPRLLQQGFRAVLDRWLGIANDELIRTQRTDAFLKAQRELLAAGVAYRLKERELVEVWCETHSMPTRTEVDDLHRTVHELRRQVRALNARLAAADTRLEAAVTPAETALPDTPAATPTRRRAAARKS
jgi:polyhydroxyalkanoate synthase subunit PhaE